MKRKSKCRKNEAGVSAVIGVIMMVAITVAIAAVVYVYVSGMVGSTADAEEETPTYIYTNYTGVLRGCWLDIDEKDPIYIGEDIIHDVYISTDETEYLYNFIGKDITLILVEYQVDQFFGYDTGDIVFIGAYLN